MSRWALLTMVRKPHFFFYWGLKGDSASLRPPLGPPEFDRLKANG